MTTQTETVWTLEQVLALAPDAASVKRGKTLASVSVWPVLGSCERTLWGECQGSGKRPYRSSVDFGQSGRVSETPAFYCSCPSRKFPCKHVIGLLLLWVRQAGFAAESPPSWVIEWSEKKNRAPTEKGYKKKGREKEQQSEEAREKKAQQAQKRLEKRAAKVAEGIVDLDRWLQDILRRGLADLPSVPYSFWDQAAARLVDAQAPGLAGRVKVLAGIPYSGKGWPERMLKALGQLYLLVKGYGELAQLSPQMQAEVRSQIGFSITKETLLQRAGVPTPEGEAPVVSVSDTWQVLGKVITEEESLKTQRVWLWGMASKRAALVLSFAHGRRQPLDVSLVPGDSFAGRVVFYPGTGQKDAGFKALVVERGAAIEKRKGSKLRVQIGFAQTDEAIAHYAQSLIQNPWQLQFPLILQGVLLRYDNQRWRLEDAAGRQLPIAGGFDHGWELLAMSGGRSLSVFGEWTGETLLPLSVWSERKFMALEN